MSLIMHTWGGFLLLVTGKLEVQFLLQVVDEKSGSPCCSAPSRGVFLHQRLFMCQGCVFQSNTCKSVCVYESLSGCGWTRLALSVRKAMKTNSSSNNRGEANPVLRRRERVLLNMGMREGNSVPPSPAFARPCVCFKLQPSLSKCVSVRHLERGERKGWPVSALCVCVCEEQWHGVWLSTQLLKRGASPSLKLRMLVCRETRGFIVACIPERGFSWLCLWGCAVWAGCDWEEGGRQWVLCPLVVFLLYRKKKAEEPVLLLWVSCGYRLLSRRACFEG